ncbi:HD domain-containing protein [Clostridia bacterium]|nr:HD domain-containing protein [Clostridia bacterium]
MKKRVVVVRSIMEKCIWSAYEEKRMSRKQFLEELHHLYGVSQWSQHLAYRRGLVPDIACVIGLMHDIGRIEMGWDGEKHVSEGAKLAKKILADTGLFNDTELKIIKKAIKRHNRKDKVELASYAELIKDADLMSRYYEEPGKNLSASKRLRLKQLQEELAPIKNQESLPWSFKKFIPKRVETR